MISDCFFALTFYFVGLFTCIDKFFNTSLDDISAFSNLTYNLYVTLAELFSLYISEDIDHILHILRQLTLVMCCYRDDMVHRQIAHYTCFDLYLLGVCLPFYLVTCLQLVTFHHVHRLEHLDRIFVEVAVEALRTT